MKRTDAEGSGPLEDDLDLERSAFDVEREGFDLFRAAALIGRIEAPNLDLGPLEAEASRLAERTRERLRAGAEWPAPLAALVEVLFYEADLLGDEEDYDAPDNSFLHRVIERRRGLPISLGVLTCEVARRADIEAYGIGFPGHFLVGVHRASREDPTDLIVIDPFHRGRPLGPKDLEGRLRGLLGRPSPLLPEHVMAAPPAATLIRMLTNLQRSYARRGDDERQARTLSRLLLLRPKDGALALERAELRRRLLDAEGAHEDAKSALVDPRVRARAERLLETLDEDRRWVH